VHFLVSPYNCRFQPALPSYSPLPENSMCTSMLVPITAEFNLHFIVTPRNCRMPTYLFVHLVLFRHTTNVPRHASLKLLCDMIRLSCHIPLNSRHASRRLRGHTISVKYVFNPLKPRDYSMYHKKSNILPTQCYLCVLCGSQNKQRLFTYKALTDWFL